MKVLGDPGKGLLPAGIGGSGTATDAQMAGMEALLREGLAQGAVAITAARDAGQDVTTEAYPYGAGMTEIQSALFDDWATWPDERFALHQLVSAGERLTHATFGKARAEGGTVIIHGRSDAQTRAAIVRPLSMISSDGFIENGREHPRTSGTFAKVLGRYVRDEGAVPLMDALRRMTLEPARRLSGHERERPHRHRSRCGPDDLRSGDGDRPGDV
jgi:N-acyl-D-aspartate/D-glutamate deacylase